MAIRFKGGDDGVLIRSRRDPTGFSLLVVLGNPPWQRPVLRGGGPSEYGQGASVGSDKEEGERGE